MKRILVITNRFKDTDNKTTQRVCDFLASMDVDVTQISVDRKVSILGAWIPEGVELAIILWRRYHYAVCKRTFGA